MSAVITALLLLVGAPALLAALYLLVLTLASGRAALPPPAKGTPKFAVVVPAHNEALNIAATVRSLLAMDWPSPAREVWVIADNCTDDTATLARAAGAVVIERQDAVLRGKGYALAAAYEQILRRNWADAVVVVDADTEVSPNLLRAFAARIAPQSGTGSGAVQAFYGVRNPLASTRTQLSTIALAIFHRLRGRAREALGLPNKLNGNGMCFTTDTLRRVPHQAFSIVEDMEYGVALAEAGIRVRYADEAEVRAEMVSTAKAAESQRQRWEGGRAEMRQRYGLPLLRRAWQERSLLLADVAMDVLVPPLSQLLLLIKGWTLVCGLLAYWGLAAAWLAPLGIAALLGLALHVLRGMSLSGLGMRAVTALLSAPGYVLWKVWLRLKRPAGQDWVRTRREAETPKDGS